MTRRTFFGVLVSGAIAAQVRRRRTGTTYQAYVKLPDRFYTPSMAVLALPGHAGSGMGMAGSLQ